MDPEFWHRRWSRDEIGFHQHDFNRHMLEFTGRMALEPGAHLFVPLCGKSLDMLWLAHQGYRVTGVEINERAVRDFFGENRLEADVEEHPEGKCFRGDGIDIWCADFFGLQPARASRIDGVYDRAALIALPASMRPAYAAHMAAWTPAGSPTLLVTLEYPEREMDGPPFSVPPDEVRALLSPWHSIAPLRSEDCLDREPRFRRKGLSRMREHVYLLHRKTQHRGPPA